MTRHAAGDSQRASIGAASRSERSPAALLRLDDLVRVDDAAAEPVFQQTPRWWSERLQQSLVLMVRRVYRVLRKEVDGSDWSPTAVELIHCAAAVCVIDMAEALQTYAADNPITARAEDDIARTRGRVAQQLRDATDRLDLDAVQDSARRAGKCVLAESGERAALLWAHLQSGDALHLDRYELCCMRLMPEVVQAEYTRVQAQQAECRARAAEQAAAEAAQRRAAGRRAVIAAEQAARRARAEEARIRAQIAAEQAAAEAAEASDHWAQRTLSGLRSATLGIMGQREP